jgi:hypothetical protein
MERSMIALASNGRVPAFLDARKPAFAASGQEADRRTDDARDALRVAHPLSVAAHRINPTRQLGPEERATPARRGHVVHEHLVRRNHWPCHKKSVDGASGKWRGSCFANDDNPGKVDAS